MEILHLEVVLYFNSNVPQGGIYPHIQFERDPLNTFRLRALTSSGSTVGGRGDAKTIISPNEDTSFGDILIINAMNWLSLPVFLLIIKYLVLMRLSKSLLALNQSIVQVNQFSYYKRACLHYRSANRKQLIIALIVNKTVNM